MLRLLCYSFLLALLFTKMIFLSFILQTSSKYNSNVFLSETFSGSSCHPLGFQSKRKQIQMVLDTPDCWLSKSDNSLEEQPDPGTKALP